MVPYCEKKFHQIRTVETQIDKVTNVILQVSLMDRYEHLIVSL